MPSTKRKAEESKQKNTEQVNGTEHAEDKKKKKKKLVGEETTLDSDILMAEVENEAPQKEKKRSKHSETVEDDEEDQDYTEKQQADADSDLTPISKFNISEQTVRKLAEKGIHHLFPIQAATFEFCYAGHDVIARARTGTGKTLAFVIPVLERIFNGPKQEAWGRVPRVLCMCPTRELALQVSREFEFLGRHLKSLCVYGGVPYDSQLKAIREGIDILIGTPGRIKDLLGSGKLKLTNIEYVILDEADEMLNIGFAEQIEEVLSAIPTDKPRQTLLFSATIPDWVKKVAKKYLKPDHKVIDLVSSHKEKTPKKWYKYFITADYSLVDAVGCRAEVLSGGEDSYAQRSGVLGDIVKVYGKKGRTIIFCNTKAEANEIATNSSLRGDCQVLHGDIVQAQREVTMQAFRDGKFNNLVATDVAARGLDITGVDLIVQCQPPKDHETYIHRAGRTGRAGRHGTVITFFTRAEANEIKELESAIGVKIERIGIPQPADIIKAAVKTAVRDLDAVHEDVLPMFEEVAKKLIAERGDVRALAQSLACLTGYTMPFKARSLLTSRENYTTILMRTEKPIVIFSPSFVLTVLRNRLSEEEVAAVKDIYLLEHESGAVFDMPNELATKFLAANPNARGITFELCKELPLLKEKPMKPMLGRGGAAGTRGRPSRGGAGGGFSFGGSGEGSGWANSRLRGGSRGGFSGRGGSAARGGFSRGGGSRNS